MLLWVAESSLLEIDANICNAEASLVLTLLPGAALADAKGCRTAGAAFVGATFARDMAGRVLATA